ncbi:MAG: UMP kinase [Candidatus Aenigmarchaeota archaeon]
MRIVFDIGGSILCPEGVPDVNYIKKFSKFIIDLRRKKHRIIVVTGGGKIAKSYIETARSFKPGEDTLDFIGILGTRMNAMVLISALGKHAYNRLVKNKERLEEAIKSGKVVVMGGTVLRQTTDAVSVAAAEFSNADLIIIGTDVKGIYDKDPGKHKNAKMLRKISPKELHEMVMVKKHKAGPLTIMDPVAARLLEHTMIKTIVLNGRDFSNMKKAICGKKFVGTVIG